MGVALKNLKKSFSPEFWTFKTYFVTAIVLLCLNAFGPQGLFRFILLFQERTRLSTQVSNQKKEIESTQKALKNFRTSDHSKLKIIRQELGLLKPDEISIELIESDS